MADNAYLYRFTPEFRELIAFNEGIEKIWISEEPENTGHIMAQTITKDIIDLGFASDYYYAKENGFEGTEQDWLDQLMIYATKLGQANGVATLNGAGKVPAEQLPSYVDDVVEFANKNAFPRNGEVGKIYVALDTNKIYRWSGTSYMEISSALDVLDDNAGVGVVDYTWTADKLATRFTSDSPNFTGTLSLNRKPNTTSGSNSVSVGLNNEASGKYSFAEGYGTHATGIASHAEGEASTASGGTSHSEGGSTTAQGNYSHAEGRNSLAKGAVSHAEGDGSSAAGDYSHAEGHTTTHGMYSHAEGENSITNGRNSHAEGEYTTTGEMARGSHAEGFHTVTNGEYSHSEGYYTAAAGSYSSVSGMYNTRDSINFAEWPEWTNTRAYTVGDKVRVTREEQHDGYIQSTIKWYICKTANVDQEFTLSHWIDQKGKMTFAEIVGNGESENTRSNARALDWQGNEYLKGDVFVGCDSNSSGGTKLATVTDVANVIDDTAGSGDNDSTWSADKLNGLLTRIEDLEYIPISLNSLSVSPSLVELGSTQNTATLSYSMNKDAVQMKLDNNVISNTSASGTISLTDLSLTANKTWTLKAKDERNREVSKNVSLTFTNKVKYGAAASATINDTFLNSLPTRTLSTGKIKNITVTTNATNGADQYIWYALPVSYGTCKFTVGGFAGGFSLVSTFNHTNESGFAVEYRVYRSDNPNLGSQTITIS